MQSPAEPAHIKRAANALICANCKQTKEIRKKTTPENVARWVREHERCRLVKK